MAASRTSFVLERDGQPILALLAASLGAARKLCASAWFKEDLATIYRSGGRSLWDGQASLAVRPSTPSEHAEVLVAEAADRMRQEDTKFVFVFLVPIDPERH